MISHSLSQEEFAGKLNTTRQTVSRREPDQPFDAEIEKYTCGVYRGASMEVAETECFSLILYCSSDKNTMGMKLYSGFEKKKKPVAVCERDLLNEKTEYAYLVKDTNIHCGASC